MCTVIMANWMYNAGGWKMIQETENSTSKRQAEMYGDDETPEKCG